ncbi:MAG: hypothetical protein ACLVEV_09895 [Lachnospiraceae bacterium]
MTEDGETAEEMCEGGRKGGCTYYPQLKKRLRCGMMIGITT